MRYSFKMLGLLVAVVVCSAPLFAQLRPETADAPEKKSPPKASRIVVETSPSAEVYLDDVYQGRAGTSGRVVIANPKAGERTLRVTLEGKKDHEERVAVAAGKDTTVRVELADLPARIAVHSSPEVDVFLDDTRRGTTNASGDLVIPDVPAGSHVLRVSAPGKKDFQEQVSATAGKEASVQATLTDQRGKLVLQSSPDADVFLDETHRGTTDASGDLVLSDVPAGPHTLRVIAHGKKDFQQQVSITAGKETGIQVTLTDLAGRIVVHSSPGADVLLDDVRRGTTDAGGDLVVPNVPPGAHDLRVWATGKKNYQQQVSVSPGQETRIEAGLAPVEPPAAPSPAAPPPVHTFRVSVKMGMLMFTSGTLTIDDTKASFHSDNHNVSFEFSLAEVERAYETLGDLGTRHDLHVLLKSGRRHEMFNAEGAGHGSQGVQFVSQAIALLNAGQTNRQTKVK